VNSAAFINEFLRLGCIERKKLGKQTRECAEGIEKRKQKYLHDREVAFEKLRQSTVKTTYTEEEAKSAYEKFSLLSISHDVFSSGALRVCLPSSSSHHLTPHRVSLMVVNFLQLNFVNNFVKVFIFISLVVKLHL
jgi:hypothetical protein